MELKRKLGFAAVFCSASGAMISSGLFVLPGLVFAEAGPAVVLVYALAALLVIPAMFSKVELATAMPKAGGSYFFIERSLGALPGTLAGLANWFSVALKSAFALVGIGAFAQLIAPGIGEWTIKIIAIGACLMFTILNLLSVKATGWFQVVMLLILLAVLGVFLVYGFPATEHRRFADFMGKGPSKILATVGLIFVSYGGLTKVASFAGEVRNPGRNIPLGMISSYALVSVLYVAAVFVMVGTVDAGELSGSRTPLSLSAANTSLGRPVGIALLAGAAMLAFFTTANGGLLAASRSPMAMSRDRLLPPIVQKVSRRFGTPWVSILLTSGFMIVVICGLSIPNLVKVASTMMLMLFLLVNAAVLVMRGSKIQNYRPLFRSPFYPWLQFAGILTYGFLLVEMGAEALLTVGIFAAVGLLWYVLYVRTRADRESAFVYMVKKIVSKDIYRSELEEELKEIALERDEVAADRFDQIVRKCVILDLPQSITADEMFQEATRALAPRLGIDRQRLVELFRARETDSSTVIQPGLAIPHIVVDGEKLFDLLLVRCKKGVLFPAQDVPVRTAFIIIGSRDERNYHLKALMAIAQIVQEPGFNERWLQAGGEEHLRDIVLLSRRKREA